MRALGNITHVLAALRGKQRTEADLADLRHEFAEGAVATDRGAETGAPVLPSVPRCSNATRAGMPTGVRARDTSEAVHRHLRVCTENPKPDFRFQFGHI